jgi:cell division septation protein DedD
MTSKNLKNFEFRLGRQGVILFAVGMSLLLFFVFIFGVMTGIHIDAYPERIAGLPEIIRKQLYHPALKTERLAAGREETKIPLKGDESKIVAPLPDILSPKGEELKAPSPFEENKPLSPVSSPADAVKASNGKKKSADVENGADTRPAKTMPALKEPGNKLTPADSGGKDAVLPPKAGGKYLVQAGSFKSHDKAKELSKKIISLGYEPRVTTTEVAGRGKWFRVVMEGFATKDEAKKAAGVLSEEIKGLNCIVRPIK